MTTAIELYGTEEAIEAPILLSAGALTAQFSGGALRDIRIGGAEFIRGLHFLVRDRNWSTLMPALSDVRIEQGADSFRVSYRADGKTSSDGQSFGWTGTIEGTPTGLRFSAEGGSDVEFTTARTGFVVLHPLEKVAGCPVTVEHADGTSEEAVFPELIEPMQVFFDIVALTHSPLPGLTATCRMEGGVWEMEDHRNWGDASFKTYFRPLGLPWPYQIPLGEKISQSVTLSLTGNLPTGDSGSGEPSIVLGDRTGQDAPEIGLMVDERDMIESVSHAAAVHDLGVQYLALRVASDTQNLGGKLGAAARLAAGLATALEIVIAERGASDAAELEMVAMSAAVAGLYPETVAVTPASDLKSYPPSVDRAPGAVLSSLYEAAREAFPGAAIGGGSFSFFPELNRRRPPSQLLDFQQHGFAAIVHAADDVSVMEAIETLPHQIRSARALALGVPLRVGPVAIAMSLNPYGSSLTPNPDNGRVTMARSDPRHGAQFGAAFAAACLARLTASGVESVTIGAPTGDFGLFGPDGAIPAAAVIRRFAEFAGGAVLQASSSQPQKCLAAAIEKGGRRLAVLVNLTPNPMRAPVTGWPAGSLSLLAAGSRDFVPAAAFSGTVDLPAYGVACLEG